MSDWNEYPENWMEKWNGCMISYIEGLEDAGWCIEAGSFNDHPLFGRPEWAVEYELGYRYYVLRYNIFDGRENANFYKRPREAQEAFEKFRDPLGKHK